MNLTKDCSGCHAPCCRHLPDIKNEELQALRTPSGMCINLGHDNKCTVYDNRPFFCKCGYMYENFYKTYDMSEQQYVDMRDSYCERLKQEFPEE